MHRSIINQQDFAAAYAATKNNNEAIEKQKLDSQNLKKEHLIKLSSRVEKVLKAIASKSNEEILFTYSEEEQEHKELPAIMTIQLEDKSLKFIPKDTTLGGYIEISLVNTQTNSNQLQLESLSQLNEFDESYFWEFLSRKLLPNAIIK